MTETQSGLSCKSVCWLLGAGAGLVMVVLLLVAGSWSFAAAMISGLVIFGLLGFGLASLFCGGAPIDEAQQRAPADKPAPASCFASGPDHSAGANAAQEAEPEPEPVGKAEGETKAPAASGTAAQDETGGKPEALAAARSGQPDDLKKIKGVGPKLEGMLHDMGIFHFDQIAAWGPSEVAWADANLKGFKGRVSRDDWVQQAKTLAADGEAEASSDAKSRDV